jgi:hypothetical protein
MHSEGRKGKYKEERTTMANVEMKMGEHKKVMAKGKVQMITMG